MKRPKHPKAFRGIAVRGQTLRWQFRPGAEDSEIVVVGPERSGGRLVARLLGWRDPWFALAGGQTSGGRLQLRTSARNVPQVVGPGFVRAVIEDALDSGWDPLAPGTTRLVRYRDGVRLAD